MVSIIFKDRDGQTPLPPELRKGLKHKMIQTIGELDEYEEANIAEGIAWLNGQNHTDYLDYAFWTKLHKNLFGDVWSWAGQVRKHELNNPDFLRPHEIWSALRVLEQDAKFWLDSDTYPTKEIMARIHERLLTIHPFPNGNGRLSRILIDHMCKQIGLPAPKWGSEFIKDDKLRRKKYIRSIEEGRKSFDFKSLETFIFD